MAMRTKTFDCVRMKDRGAAAVYEKLKDVSVEQQIEYWERRTDKLGKRLEEAALRSKEGAAG